MRVILAILVTLSLVGMASADDEPKALRVRWFGLSMFQLETAAGKLVVFDPHSAPEFGQILLTADIVCISHLHADHTNLNAIENAKAARVFSGLTPGKRNRPAEWAKIDTKVGDIRIRTVGLFHDPDGGMSRGKNSAFVLELDGMTVCHLGDLGHDLTPEQVKAIGPVDVLLIPVGGVYTLNGSGAKRVMEALAPKRLVIPMHYGVPGFDELNSADEFLDGLANVRMQPGTNEVAVPPAGDDSPVVVVLGWAKK